MIPEYIKTRQQHWEHFRSRFKHRYGFTIFEQEYDNLFDNFHGLFSKTRGKTIGWTIVRGVKVWVLYIAHAKAMATCYPPEIETDIEQLIFSCYGKSLRKVAMRIYQDYVEEDKTVRKDFADKKEAALHYFENTLFPTLHIEKYEFGSVGLFKVMEQIRHIINGTSHHITIKVVRQTANT